MWWFGDYGRGTLSLFFSPLLFLSLLCFMMMEGLALRGIGLDTTILMFFRAREGV